MKNITIALCTMLCLFFITDANAQKRKSKSKKKHEIDSTLMVPEVIFESKVYNYGTILQDSEGLATFVLKNVGNANLIITNCSASCGCTVPNWPKEPIEPGAIDTITVKYDTRRLGAINKNVYVMTNAGDHRIILNLKGEVIPVPAQVVPEETSSPMFAPTN